MILVKKNKKYFKNFQKRFNKKVLDKLKLGGTTLAKIFCSFYKTHETQIKFFLEQHYSNSHETGEEPKWL